MTIGALIMLVVLPAFGGLLLWLTSRLEEHVAETATPAVVEADPPLEAGARAA